MKNSTLYAISLGFTILLTLAAFITLLGWVGTLVNGAGQPILKLLPWKPLLCVTLAAANCTTRARLIIRRQSSAGV